MIRSLTCVCALLAGASGLYLYSEKHRTTLLDQQISHIVADTQQVRERTSMLRAEWALLNQPDRLQQLSVRFLPQLGAMAPTQFVQTASLDQRLPAVAPETPPHPIVTPQTAPSLVGAQPAAGAPAQPDADAAAAIASVAAPQRPGRAAAAATVDGSSVDAMQVAAAQPVAHEAARVAQFRSRPTPHRDVQLAAETGDDDGPVARSEPASQAALRRVAARPAPHAAHVAAPVRLASTGTMSTRPALSALSGSYAHPPVITAAAWHPARASWPVARPATYTAPVAPMIGSALGSQHSSLPAPVPVSDGN